MIRKGKRQVENRHVPPFSMPLTAALETDLSTALAASLTVSVALFCRRALVLNRRAERMKLVRYMLGFLFVYVRGRAELNSVFWMVQVCDNVKRE